MLRCPLLVISACLQEDLDNTRSSLFSQLTATAQTNPGSGRREEEPGQGRQVKEALPRETHFPITPVTVPSNSEGSLLSQALLNKTHLQEQFLSQRSSGKAQHFGTGRSQKHSLHDNP